MRCSITLASRYYVECLLRRPPTSVGRILHDWGLLIVRDQGRIASHLDMPLFQSHSPQIRLIRHSWLGKAHNAWDNMEHYHFRILLSTNSNLVWRTITMVVSILTLAILEVSTFWGEDMLLIFLELLEEFEC